MSDMRNMQSLRLEIEELQTEIEFLRQRNKALSAQIYEQKELMQETMEKLVAAEEKIALLEKSRAGRKPQNEAWLERYQAFLETVRRKTAPAEAMRELGISRTSYYRFMRYYKASLVADSNEEDTE